MCCAQVLALHIPFLPLAHSVLSLVTGHTLLARLRPITSLPPSPVPVPENLPSMPTDAATVQSLCSDSEPASTWPQSLVEERT